jgi:uncharacterized protein involved in exopolysaccharide biosynthesis
MSRHDDPLPAHEAPEAASADQFWALWDSVWSAKLWIATFALGFGALAALYSSYQPDWYRSRVVLLSDPPALAQQSSGGAAAPERLRLFSAAQVPLATLRSERFAQQFLERHDLAPVLLADEWDAAAQRWRVADSEQAPDVRDALEVFTQDVLAIESDAYSGQVTVSVTWRDPELAARWAAQLVEDLESALRTEALDDAQRRVEHLKAELGATRSAAIQHSLNALLEHEMERVMLAKVSPHVAFRTIDPASHPKRPYKPDPRKWIGGGALLGALCGLLVALLRSSALERRARLEAESSHDVLEPSSPPALPSLRERAKLREVKG